MSTERWNDDIAYVFSIDKIFLDIHGMWPLQTQTLFTRTRWGFCLIALIMVIPFVMLNLTWSNQNVNTGIENILFVVLAMLAIMKHLCIARVLTLMLLYSTYACFFAYVFVNLFKNLNKSITGSQYVIILAIQLVQAVIGCSVIFIESSFFFNCNCTSIATLTHISKKIAYSAYDNPWYDFDITTGKFLSMNLFSFKEILKATGSYLSSSE
ncbi:Odorant receptor 415 [Nylanderia fulva]|uniref:Odorant receptor 415 n=1 Tax=Nylanderia fulva TaxID=613905 RepID=A0A6G1LRQ8_9HYME|nr:Odorant receptor 415 [Nylanderia fulva]